MLENRMKLATYLMMEATLVIIFILLIGHLFSAFTLFDVIPSVFVLSVVLAFLVDTIYFMGYVDFSRTFFELAMDVAIMILLVILSAKAYVLENAPLVFMMLSITFMIALLKYWIASKRHKQEDVQDFIRKKTILDLVGMFSYLISAAVSFFFGFTAPYLMLGIGISFIVVIVYLAVNPKYFSIKNKVI